MLSSQMEAEYQVEVEVVEKIPQNRFLKEVLENPKENLA